MESINPQNIPQGALEILATLEAAGYEAWLVGGCVRDLLMGRVPGDWDITTDALPAQVGQCFPHTIPTGITHGTMTVLLAGKPFEVTTYRTESAYSDFRRPDHVSFVTEIGEDLARRDFTVNAVAWHPERGLYDPYGGRQDLAGQRIKAVGNPQERFREDALRMLRAVRFAAQLDFTIEEDTLNAIGEMAPNIVHISGERIALELNKWLLAQNSHRWPLFRQSGLMAWVLPELDKCFDIPQNSPWHTDTVGDHILKAAASAAPVREVRWALLFHDLGKAQTRTTDEEGIDHFYGHEAHSEALAQEIMHRLRMDKKTQARVLALVRHHDREVAPTGKAVRRAVLAIGKDAFPQWLLVRRADLMAQNTEKAGPVLTALDGVQACYEDLLIQEHCLGIGQLAVSGKDLMALGIPQGPEIGYLLQALLEWVVEEPERNQKALLLERVAALQEQLQ